MALLKNIAADELFFLDDLKKEVDPQFIDALWTKAELIEQTKTKSSHEAYQITEDDLTLIPAHTGHLTIKPQFRVEKTNHKPSSSKVLIIDEVDGNVASSSYTSSLKPTALGVSLDITNAPKRPERLIDKILKIRKTLRTGYSESGDISSIEASDDDSLSRPPPTSVAPAVNPKSLYCQIYTIYHYN